jgi:hypothetical protein
VATPGLPLPLRNALAALAIAGLEEASARAALAWLGAPEVPPARAAVPRLTAVHLLDAGGTGLLAVHAPHAAAAAAHARRALRAADAYRAQASEDPLATAVRQAAALWDERLFFEVHEVLEALWQPATGAVRQALQGVIQIAVAFHHLAHGNRRGARSLMSEGRARLAATPAATLPGLDATALLAVTAAWESALASETGAAATDPPPALPLRG